MADNQKIKDVKLLKSLVLTEERIRISKIPIEELCVIEFFGQSFGPVWHSELHQVFRANQHLMATTRLRNFGQENWVVAAEHPHFLKIEKPPVPPEFDVADERPSIPVENENHGDGQWDDDVLPHSPKQEIFDQSRSEVLQKWEEMAVFEKDKNAIAGLAFMCSYGKERQEMNYIEEAENGIHVVARPRLHRRRSRLTRTIKLKVKKGMKHTSPKLIAGVAASFVVVFSLGSYLLFRTPEPQNSSKTAAARANVDSETPTSRSPHNIRQKRSGLRELANQVKDAGQIRAPASKTPTKPNDSYLRPKPARQNKHRNETSFRNSRAYQRDKKHLADDPSGGDDFYYDDGTDPVEQDQLRSKLSKRTIDPPGNRGRAPASDDEYYDDSGEDNRPYHDEVEPPEEPRDPVEPQPEPEPDYEREPYDSETAPREEFESDF